MGKDSKDARERLTAMAEPDGIKLLEALFARQKRVRDGVNATRFRIDFEEQREKIDKLKRWFINEDRQAKPIYRPALIALAVIENEYAKRLLSVIDRLLRLFKEEYRKGPGRQISLAEMSETLGEDQAELAEALAYFIDRGPVNGARTTGYPENGEWYFIPNENSLDFDSLDAVLEQWAEWAGHNPEASPYAAEARLNGGRPQESSGFWPWVKEHKARAVIIATIIVTALGALASIVTVLGYFGL